jgi:hypothetical protein
MTDFAAQAVTVVEIRARRDRNRLLGTYDPERGLLRLYHRGETVTVALPRPCVQSEPIDARRNVE